MLPNIENAFAGGAHLGAFTLTCLAIDCLSCFYTGEQSTGKNFAKFMKSFDSLKHYNAEKIWISMRCGLAHNYTIKENAFMLTHNNPTLHKSTTSEGATILNFDDFYNDFKQAAEEYLHLLEENTDLQKRFVKNYDNFKIIGIRKVIDHVSFDKNHFNSRLFQAEDISYDLSATHTTTSAYVDNKNDTNLNITTSISI